MMRQHACYGDDVDDLEMMAMFLAYVCLKNGHRYRAEPENTKQVQNP